MIAEAATKRYYGGMAEPWHKRSIKKTGREVAAGTAFSTTFVLALFLWNFALGKTFIWQTIAPVSAPPLVYEIYSAMVFVTFGAFLYWIRFYKFLHFIFVETLGDWRTYKQVKAIIWLLLIGLAYAAITKIVDAINSTLSVVLNLANFLLYLSPPLGAGLIVAAIVYIWRSGSRDDDEGPKGPPVPNGDMTPLQQKVQSFLNSPDETLLSYTNVAADTPDSNLAKSILQHRLNKNIVELKYSTDIYSKALIVFSLFLVIISTEQLLISIFPPTGIWIWVYVFVGLNVFSAAMWLTNKMLDRK